MAAAGVGLVDLVVAGDSLLERKRFTLDQLKLAAAGWTDGARRWPAGRRV